MSSASVVPARAPSARRLKLGVAGLGRAFMLMLPTFRAHPGIELVAAADPRPEARAQFAQDFGGRGHATFEAMCDDPGIEAVYISTPHQMHADNVVAAAARGKHVMVEKPMAITLAECARMIDAAKRAGVHLLVGHSHSFDAPYLRTRELIRTGTYGEVRMIHASYYTDFLYRPRRPEELDTSQGGGVVFSQGAHQVDIVRLLGGGRVTRVTARTGAWDPRRKTEGAYSAILDFDNGAFASITYSGYAHFDSDELAGWVGELGEARDPSQYGRARAALHDVIDPSIEARMKARRGYGNAPMPERGSVGHNHFGSVIVSCDRADIRPLPTGIRVYDDERAWIEPLPVVDVPRAEVIDELRAAVLDGVPPLHDGEWAMATLEACLAILESARTGRDVGLVHQTTVRDRNTLRI